jgi:uncharacterized membrane protein
MIEINFYRPLLDGTRPPMRDWAQRLAHDLEWPRIHLPWWEAAGRRLRRNYLGIYVILLGSWLVTLMSHPTPTTSFTEIVARAAVGPVPGSWLFVAMILFYGGLLALGVYSFWASRMAGGLPAGHPGRMSASHEDV